MDIVIINGPNLNLLGRREPEKYGSMPFEQFLSTLIPQYPQISFSYFQSNYEGAIIDYVQQVGFQDDTAIVLNAGGLTHYSVSLRDCIAAIKVPTVEVHLTDIYSREPFRRCSLLTDVCKHSIIGQGLDGYKQAIEWLLDKYENKAETSYERNFEKPKHFGK